LGQGGITGDHGRAIDPDAFRWAQGEVFGTISKIQPFLAEV
jgi:hypothetical protein